ncbi:MAG: Gfo/Idh/MocA family oxidoreductase [Nitriliruptoraceae bacterium]
MTSAAEPAPVSDGNVRWGILATGGIARTFTRDLHTHGHRIGAVGSRSLDNARSFAAEFDIPTAHGSYEDLVADPDVDAIYVATPHTFHAANARAALEHGKHVLVEKAFTINATEAREVADLGRDRGLVVLEAMWTRFLPHMAFVRQAIADGRIGEVRSLQAEHGQRLPTDPSHRLNAPELGGGALLDLGVYPLSFAHDLLGAPSEVIATGTLGPTGVDASVATVLRHEGDRISTTYSTMESRSRNTAQVLGSEGRIEIGSVWYMPAPIAVYDPQDQLIDSFERPVSGRGMQYQAAEMERLIAAGETVSPLLTPDESVAVMATMDRVRAALGVHYPGE